MGRAPDLSEAQKDIIDTLHKEGRPHKFIAEKAGCSQSSVSKHINGKLSGRDKCGRKRCTSNRDDRSLERLVKEGPFKNLGELHKEWTEAGINASRATAHRRLQEKGYYCHFHSADSMAKNKQKGKKQKNVFQVANKHLKTKNKAKPVTSALKHITAGKKEKVESLNQIFTEVQRDVTSISKSVAPEPKKQTQVVREPPKESVNVDNAAQLFSQL
ncbi:uncharacterized protein rbis [Stegastes partitus]|uniref:Uncharacterized protein rbis n=2 Tax=Stegastes partitus TaxID=144197 RepID=A0A9Y4KF32_9TELE|nr:PREDICTED: uncharacterized protein C8orf59 homolog [Stegastes partitus]